MRFHDTSASLQAALLPWQVDQSEPLDESTPLPSPQTGVHSSFSFQLKAFYPCKLVSQFLFLFLFFLKQRPHAGWLVSPAPGALVGLGHLGARMWLIMELVKLHRQVPPLFSEAEGPGLDAWEPWTDGEGGGRGGGWEGGGRGGWSPGWEPQSGLSC